MGVAAAAFTSEALAAGAAAAVTSAATTLTSIDAVIGGVKLVADAARRWLPRAATFATVDVNRHCVVA